MVIIVSQIANGTAEGKNVGAANMREITWDKCLEIVAQRWADQCVNGHDHIEERYLYKICISIEIILVKLHMK